MAGLGDAWPLLLLFLLAAGGEDVPRPKNGSKPPDPTPRPDPEPTPDPAPEPDPDDDDGDPDVYEPQPGSEPLWILPGNDERIRPRSFGQRRPFGSANPTTHHTGSDIDADFLDAVLMPEDGVVVRNGGWSGANAKATTVQLFSGPVLVLGAIHPDHRPEPGAILRRGELVGRIGRYPRGSTMLHFEQWGVGSFKDKARPAGPWKWGDERPSNLVDPTAYLESMIR